MLAAYHNNGMSDAMAYNTQLGQIPGITEVTDAVGKFTEGVKELKSTFASFAETMSAFKLRTASEVKIQGLEQLTLKMDLPTGGEIIKRGLPPLIITTAAVVGVAYLVSHFLKRTCPPPPPRAMAGVEGRRWARRHVNRPWDR